MKKIRFSLVLQITSLTFLLCCLPLSLKAQSGNEGSSSQFLYPEFSNSNVRMRNGQTQSIMLNYNTVSEKMVYQKDDKLYDMVNSEMVDTVYLEDSKFIPVGKVFYEVLVSAPTAFFAQHKGELIPPGTPAGYGGTSQVSNTKLMSSIGLDQGYYNLKLPEDYKVKAEPIYWIRTNNNMSSFINQKQFLKYFPGKEYELKQFIKQKHIKFDRQTDIVKLAEHINNISH